MQQYKQMIIALMACQKGLAEGLLMHKGEDCDCREELYDAVVSKAIDLTLQTFPKVNEENMCKGITLLLADIYTPPRALLLMLKDSEYFAEYDKLIAEANNSPAKQLMQLLASVLRR